MSESGGLIKSSKTVDDLAPLVGGVLGGIIGGYPGMSIGMALGAFLFKPKEKKGKDYLNNDLKINKSALDVVPVVLGTDMSIGKLIWFEKDTFDTYQTSMIPNKNASFAWKAFTNEIDELPGMFYAHFIVNYCDGGVINRTYFNGKDQWLWTILSDWFRQFDDPLQPPRHATMIDNLMYLAGVGDQDGIPDLFDPALNYIDYRTLNPAVPFALEHVSLTYTYFKGLLGDFVAGTIDPETSIHEHVLAPCQQFAPQVLYHQP